MLPGINRLDYSGEYWPHNVVSVTSHEITEWLQSVRRVGRVQRPCSH